MEVKNNRAKIVKCKSCGVLDCEEITYRDDIILSCFSCGNGKVHGNDIKSAGHIEIEYINGKKTEYRRIQLDSKESLKKAKDVTSSQLGDYVSKITIYSYSEGKKKEELVIKK